jgi:hypothetical protein
MGSRASVQSPSGELGAQMKVIVACALTYCSDVECTHFGESTLNHFAALDLNAHTSKFQNLAEGGADCAATLLDDLEGGQLWNWEVAPTQAFKLARFQEER